VAEAVVVLAFRVLVAVHGSFPLQRNSALQK
jgi:hypothetical protein